jgi:putative ABC transport system permease protein
VSDSELPRSRLLVADALRIGLVGLRTRPLRAALSAVGIAIGIASMVAVLGISESSKADLVSALDRLGTNLLTVTPGQSLLGEDSKIPRPAAGKIAAMGSVRAASPVVSLNNQSVRRSDYIDPQETNGIAPEAAESSLLGTLSGSMASGHFLTAAGTHLPVVVLGALTAKRLGIRRVGRGNVEVYIGGHWFTVVGVMRPAELAPELDNAALIGYPVAHELFGTSAKPSTIYVRTDPGRVVATRDLLPPTANPEHPEEVEVSRPSDALAARAAAKTAFTALFLGLGAIALLVGGVGIANVMVISVLERRSEIGLRRALGATRRHITVQFLAEALLLSASGGVAGAALGAAATVTYAVSRGWSPVVAPATLGAAVGAAVTIGAVAGLYPAARAARLAPTEALRTA